MEADWIEIAKGLPVGGRVYIDCTCGGGRTLAVNNNGVTFSTFCFRCPRNDWTKKGKLSIQEIEEWKKLNAEARSFTSKVRMPRNCVDEIPLEGRLWLYKASITDSDIRKYKICYDTVLKRVVLPVYNGDKLSWFVARAIFPKQEPKYIAPSVPNPSALFLAGHDNKVTQHGKRVVIVTEDIISAIRVGEFFTCASILGTSASIEQLNTLKGYVVVLWLDGDDAGHKGTKMIGSELSLVTTVGNIYTDKDPKEYTRSQICEIVNDCLNNMEDEYVR